MSGEHSFVDGPRSEDAFAEELAERTLLAITSGQDDPPVMFDPYELETLDERLDATLMPEVRRPRSSERPTFSHPGSRRPARPRRRLWDGVA